MSMVEHWFNTQGEVAAILPPLEAAPVGWSVDESSKIWLCVPGSLDQMIEISPDCLRMAVASEKLLVIEVAQNDAGDVDLRESVVPFQAD